MKGDSAFIPAQGGRKALRKQIDVEYNVSSNLTCQTKGEVFKMAGRKNDIKATGVLIDDRGVWVVRARVYDPRIGGYRQKSKSTGFKVKDSTKRKAEKAMANILERWGCEEEIIAPTYNPRYEEYVIKWLEKKAISLKGNSVKSYQDYANKHILPVLGKMKVTDMCLRHLQAYYKEKLKVLSVNSVKKHHVVISGALLDAVRDGVIPVNFAEYVEFPKTPRFEGKSYTQEQVSQLLLIARHEGEPIQAAIILAVCYGLRRSEICGLRWSDIDFEKAEMSIKNTFVQNGTLRIEAEQTKTKKSRRTISLVGSTIPYFQELLNEQVKMGLQLDKVCRWPDGSSARPDYVTYKVSSIMKAHGLEQIRLHDLRHTAATLLSTRATPKQVQEFLGHEDISTTMNIYTHLLDMDRKETSSIMDGILKSL